MGRVARPLEAMGARFAFEGGQHLPLTITGGDLQPLTWESPTASAQVKSAILLAGPLYANFGGRAYWAMAALAMVSLAATLALVRLGSRQPGAQPHS